jgi:hypothetical protein
MKTPTSTRPLLATVAVAILAVTILQGPAPVATPPAAAASELHEDAHGIYGADPELTAVVEAAIDRFNTTGLALPPLRIYTYRTTDGCQSNSGLFNGDGSATRIDLCTRGNYLILHELAHAWEHHTLSDTTRQAFLDRTGLGGWNDSNLDWEDRGIEAAAQVIAWGLLDTPITNAEAFGEELQQFKLLTGINSPRLPNS